MIATDNTQPNVCFGSLADTASPLPNLRSTAESGHHRKLLTNPISTGSPPPTNAIGILSVALAAGAFHIRF